MVAVKAQWEADKCSKHCSYRLKGKAGNNRPMQLTSVRTVAARFCALRYRHMPVGMYIEQFRHRDYDK